MWDVEPSSQMLLFILCVCFCFFSSTPSWFVLMPSPSCLKEITGIYLTQYLANSKQKNWDSHSKSVTCSWVCKWERSTEKVSTTSLALTSSLGVFFYYCFSAREPNNQCSRVSNCKGYFSELHPRGLSWSSGRVSVYSTCNLQIINKASAEKQRNKLERETQTVDKNLAGQLPLQIPGYLEIHMVVTSLAFQNVYHCSFKHLQLELKQKFNKQYTQAP